MDTIPGSYKILVLAPFAPLPEESYLPVHSYIDLYSCDEVLKKLSPVLYLPLSSGEAVTFKPEKMKDFRPAQMARMFPEGTGTKAPAKTAEKSEHSESAIDDILSMVDASDSKPSLPPSSQASTSGVEEIFASSEFQQLEEAWQGLRTLLKKAEIKGENPVTIRITPANRDHMGTVLDDVSSLPTDQLPNLVLIDMMFDASLPSIERLEKVIEFAERMMIPVCVGIEPGFFRADNFSRINTLPYLTNFLDDISYSKFRKLKELPGASWVMACCNGFAARPVRDCEASQPYVSPVWAMGICSALSVNQSGWPTAFSRYTDIYIEDLPMADAGGSGMASTQGLIGDEKIIQLVEAGFTPVIGIKNKDRVCIPKEGSLTGDSFKFQMFFNRVIETLIRIKEQSTANADPVDALRQGLKDLFAETCGQVPGDLSVNLPDDQPEGQTLLQISFTPPGAVLMVSNPIAFSFAW